MKSGENDLLNKLEDGLRKKYNEIDAEKILDLIYRLSILVCIERNDAENKRLQTERKKDEKELKRLKDKEGLVEELTELKKQKAKEIKKIDKTINNNELLIKEFNKRNEKLPKYKKIFGPDVLLGTLKREREKLLTEIDEANKLLDAKNYVEEVTRLEKDLDLLREIENLKNKEKYKLEIQKLFIKCLEDSIYKIDTPEHKKHIISLFHILRYYNFILFDENRFIKDVEELRENIEILEEKVILKLYDFKVLNPITKDIETDVGIIKPILNTRILDLGKVVIQTIKQGNDILVKAYDGSIEEIEFSIENLNNVEFKNKKKIKLFAK